jgi:FkbM family methyltransferase
MDEQREGPNRAQSALIALVRASVLRRGFFRKAMGDVVRWLGPDVVETTFRGARFRVHVGDNLTERDLLLNPCTDKEELDFLVDATPVGGVFVDIGANIGMYALVMAAALGGQGRVVAIEPDPLIRARLLANAELSHAGNVTVCAEAAGDKDGEVSFARNENNLGESQIVQGGSVRVRMRPLTAILAEAKIDHIDSLKIDVEGYEDRVLLPFFREAPQSLWPRAVVIEHIHPEGWLDDCLAELAARGYRTAKLGLYNAMLLR